MAIETPRFDAAPIDRIRSQIMSGIVANAKDPETAAQFAWAKALYGEHPYSRRDEGTEQTLASITADDLKSFHKRLFARENLTVAVVGAIDAETLKLELDKLFGDLPEKPSLQQVDRVQPKLAQEIRIPYDLPQASSAACLSRYRAKRSAIFRRVPDEPYPWRRDVHVPALQ